MNYHGITLYPERDERLTDIAKDLLGGFYTSEGETFQEAFARPALAFCGGDLELAQAIYDDVSKGWAMYSSPILSNAPAPGETAKSMPISCFLSYVPDTREGLVDHQAELAWLSMMGGGVGGHWSDIRAVSPKSVGPIPHIKIADSAIEGFRQGVTRKGSYAAYIDISHPDISEFISMRSPTGGDVNRKSFNVHHAINITDAFMRAVVAGEGFELACPHSGKVTETVDARKVWEQILDTRYRTGEPYLNFIDAAQRGLNPDQKAKGLKIRGSNLCNEIHLATSPDRTAVCCLSSVNLRYYLEWKKDDKFIYRWVKFLDNVLEFFIQNAPAHMEKAVRSAKAERSIGLGTMGYHSLLQSLGSAFDNPFASSLNNRIFASIQSDATIATVQLAAERGAPSDLKLERNAHLLAIAPNANSALICGVSPSIEPYKANVFSNRGRAGTHLIVNEELSKVLDAHGKNTPEVIREILLNDGSVADLDFLTDNEKNVFKTAFEIDQLELVKQAGDRQKYICQGQSVNLFFKADAPASYVNAVHIQAWKREMKGLYYLRTESGATGDKVSNQIQRRALSDYRTQAGEDECVACQG